MWPPTSTVGMSGPKPFTKEYQAPLLLLPGNFSFWRKGVDDAPVGSSRNDNMSFNKKDEDDAGIVKVDRTSVFQEGQL